MGVGRFIAIVTTAEVAVPHRRAKVVGRVVRVEAGLNQSSDICIRCATSAAEVIIAILSSPPVFRLQQSGAAPLPQMPNAAARNVYRRGLERR
jgi:hypothetical protein